MDLSQLEEGTGRSVPSTPVEASSFGELAVPSGVEPSLVAHVPAVLEPFDASSVSDADRSVAEDAPPSEDDPGTASVSPADVSQPTVAVSVAPNVSNLAIR